MKIAPIVLFTYNRPTHTRETVEALLKNQYASASDLIIFSDAPKNGEAVNSVNETRQYLKTITGFQTVQIIERTSNYGLANNIIEGVSEILGRYDRIIVLEDDLITSPYFLEFMNGALNMYENDSEVISVHGYVYPLKGKLAESFFIKGADCLGWGTWKRGWDLFIKDGTFLLDEIKKKHLEKAFDFSNAYPYTRMLENQVKGSVGSWAIRWYASAFIQNKLTLYPSRSLIFHNGNDNSGTNYGLGDELTVDLSESPIRLEKLPIMENEKARAAFIHYFRYTVLLRKIQFRIKKLLQR